MTNPNASHAGIWRDALQIFPDLWAFIKHPTIGETAQIWTPLVWRQLVLLFLFDLVLMLPMIVYLKGYEELLATVGVPIPQYAGFDEDASFVDILLIAGLIGPVIEEILFRGWLKGTRRQLSLLALCIFSAIVGTIASSYTSDLPDSARRFLLVVLFVAAVAATLNIFHRTKVSAAPAPLFEKTFPIIVWTSVVLFGLVHITNYEGDTYWATAPMVLPQLAIAPVWAFARLRFGLGASILLHGASNSFLMLLMSLGLLEWS